MIEQGGSRVHERWARLRFSIIGALLAAPPAKGELSAALRQLAAREWRHPSTGAPVRFSVSTLERWLYRARNEQHDPVSVLRRKRRQDAGDQASMTPALRQALLAQYTAHKSWSAQLHRDNLVALAETRPELRPVPSYTTIRRFLAAHGLTKYRPVTTRRTEGALAAEARLEAREVRSYESEYVGGLWHWDCHVGSAKVLTPRGEWQTPVLFGVLDDRSRLACHLQWYLAESAENIAHGLSQAMQKRGLPRAAMSDNGAAMTATEITEGLARLGILHQTTLPYSPYQNGKQEALWGSVEGRLMAMLEAVDDLTLARLNEATQAWVEQDYNRKRHSEIDDTPLARFLAGPAVISRLTEGLVAQVSGSPAPSPDLWTATQDSELRFYSVLWVAYGAAVMAVGRRLERRMAWVPPLSALFFLGGVGRALSWLAVGQPHLAFTLLMIVELALPPLFLGLWVLARRQE